MWFGCWHSIVRHENHSIRQKRSGANTLENKGIREVLNIITYTGENISLAEVGLTNPIMTDRENHTVNQDNESIMGEKRGL